MKTDDFPFIIKVCGITNSADGQYAVKLGATALGFNFYQNSPRYVTPLQARSFHRQIRGEYLSVGIFVNATEAELRETAELARLDILQLHGELPDSLPREYRLWRAISAAAKPAVPDISFEAYLLDTPTSAYGGSGIPFDWSLAAGFPARSIVAGGLHGGNVFDAIAATHPSGVDACSRLESTPGRKDPALVKAFIEAAMSGYRSVKQHHAQEMMRIV